MNFPNATGRPPRRKPARIIKITEFDENGNELPPVYCVVEGTNTMTILCRCATFQQAKDWIDDNGYTYVCGI